MANHRKGTDDAHPPEKTNHVPHINKALTDALNQWQPGDPTNVDIIFQASISPNPGGIGQYRVIIKQQETNYP